MYEGAAQPFHYIPFNQINKTKDKTFLLFDLFSFHLWNEKKENKRYYNSMIKITNQIKGN